MTLKKGIVWSQKKMRPQSVRLAGGKYNPIMQKVMSNQKIAKALDQPRERKEFFGMLKSVSKDGVYQKELRKLFGDLRSGKVRSRTINAKELRTIAKEIFPDSKRRYIFSGPAATEKSGSTYTQVDPSAKNSASENTNAGRQSSFIRYKPKKVSARATSSPAQGVASLTPAKMATIMNRIRENGGGSSENEGNDQPKGDFSRAMEATKKSNRG
ncbi:MAG: hypothetical protein WC726_00020 [Parcubacteria group bacterium]|jgi:hypothetical protein